MGCISSSGGTICTPPYDVMKPTEFGEVSYGNITLQEDATCALSTFLLWGAGITLGYVLADKFVAMLR